MPDVDAILEARRLLQAERIEPTPILVKALNLLDAADRRVFIDELAGRSGPELTWLREFFEMFGRQEAMKC